MRCTDPPRARRPPSRRRRTREELIAELREVVRRAEELLAEMHGSDRLILRLDSAAAALDTPRETLRTWARAGKLRPVHIGRNCYFARADLVAFVERHRQPDGSGA